MVSQTMYLSWIDDTTPYFYKLISGSKFDWKSPWKNRPWTKGFQRVRVLCVILESFPIVLEDNWHDKKDVKTEEPLWQGGLSGTTLKGWPISVDRSVYDWKTRRLHTGSFKYGLLSKPF